MATEGEYQALPPKDAIAFFRQKLNLPSKRWTDVLRQGHDRAFVVAGASKMELLQDLRSSVDKALAQGTTLEQFRKDFDELVSRHGWTHKGGRAWRTRVIYETNLSTSYAAGRHAQMTDPDVLEARPYWQYRHGGSLNPREQHLGWDGLVLPASDPWWGDHYPPNGWGCSCSAYSLSDADVKERGLTVAEQAPASETYEWMNPNTGEVEAVPAGIEPGWNYTPGKSWLHLHAKRLEGVDRSLARLNVGELVDSEVFSHWLEEPEGEFPVGVIDDPVAGAIKAEERVVRLSGDTMAKQLEHHPELQAKEYRLLPELIDAGKVVQDGERTVVFFYQGKRLYMAVVKATRSGRGLFVTTFHRLDDLSEMKRLEKRGQVIRDFK